MKYKISLLIVALIATILTLSYFIYNTIQEQKRAVTLKEKLEIEQKYRESQHMRYKLTNKTVLLPTQSNQLFKKMDVKIDSTLEVVLFKEDSELFLGMQFDEFTYTLNGSTLQKADKLLLEPFLISLSNSTSIDEILFSKKLSKQYKKQIKSLIKTLHIDFAEGRKSWTTSEENSNGTYESNYTYKKSKQLVFISKKILSYIAYPQDETEIEVLKSDISAVLDTQPWLKELNYLQSELYAIKKKPMMSSKVITTLKRVKKINNRMLISTFTNVAALRKYLNKDVGKRTNTKQTHTQQVSSEKIIHGFFSCIKNGNCNFLNIKENLLAYLTAHPEDMHIILSMLKDSKYKDFHHKLINALQELGIPEAQKAMINIIQNSDYSSSNRTQSAMAIGFLQEPTHGTILKLREMYESGLLEQDQEISTYYALGNLASSSQEAYEQIAPSIINDLESSISTEDTVAALGALENTQNNEILDHVTPYLTNINTAVRKGAVQALRLTSSPKATKALHKQLQEEEYDLVINAIAYSLHNKKDITPQIIKDIAIKSTSKIKKSNDTMMLKTVDFLVKKSKTNEDAKNALKEMMGKNLSIEAKKRIIRGL